MPDCIKNSDSDPSGKSSLTKADSHNSGASDGVWYTQDQYNREFYTAVDRQEMTYDDCDEQIYLTYDTEENFDVKPPPTLVVKEAMLIKNVQKEIEGLSVSELNDNFEANYVSQEDANLLNSVAPWLVDSSTVQDTYDENVLVGIYQGNDTASITPSLTT